jgi:serine/threonine protein kinase
MDVPDPITEEWVKQAISELPDETLTEAIKIVRGRGGRQAELLDRALRRRDASVTEVEHEAAAGGVLDATMVDATVVEAEAAGVSVGGRPTDRAPGQVGELVAGTQFAGYVIEGVAGQGGMGVVYRARQLRPSRIVALKVISPQLAGDSDFRERFAHESEIATSIEHSNVIPVYDVGEESNLLYITMRYVEGTDLRAVIAAEGHLAPQRAVQILVELTAALDAAHAHGLVHRDVKPGNLLRAEDGAVKLADFGIAKATEQSSITQVGSVLGTAAYLAPEQARGEEAGPAADLYALGVVTYQLMSGRLPYEANSLSELALKQQNEAPAALDELNPEVGHELAQAVARSWPF